MTRSFLLNPARRAALSALAGAALATCLPLPSPARAAKTLRIGYQKSSTLITVLKVQGTLEKRLAEQGVAVSWHEFTNGQPLLEALNVGAIDLSADVADTVPLFAQAAGAALTYYARETPAPSAQAIIVRADSPIRSIADLKGRKVGFARAAGAHYLVIAALERHGLNVQDIQQAYLSPADGRAAFDNGSIDAWAIWDPFYAAVEQHERVRLLADGREGLADYARYYLASTPYVDAHAHIVAQVFDALREAGAWVKQQPGEAAALLAPAWGLDPAIVAAANQRRTYDVRPVSAANLDRQQQIGDVFLANKLLPRRIDLREARVWAPAG
ncbi:aliphatic sulfonate ABC transporter substrate-binding protein [Bordetella petrii]|uniref:Putative aliphatic sulfonates-binding protein n=1 Tax=Bordetella petrii (strain ATCC BAA-461 / DSM 12804 / CCUG 43448 / CIP 107267 / Se-1111R) TaxID=340100 RepID=A9I3Y6_BORPD|nr:aliphatic sulfonate ABC transporter substrate-binding protein [Bordetella petrii]CAP44229.1 putative aliphatic sulfonates periplasmic substrate-binding protein [Bordetella petrii]